MGLGAFSSAVPRGQEEVGSLEGGSSLGHGPSSPLPHHVVGDTWREASPAPKLSLTPCRAAWVEANRRGIPVQPVVWAEENWGRGLGGGGWP